MGINICFAIAVSLKLRFETHYVGHAKHPPIKINSPAGVTEGLLEEYMHLRWISCSSKSIIPEDAHLEVRAPLYSGTNAQRCTEPSHTTAPRVSTDTAARLEAIKFSNQRSTVEAEDWICHKYSFRKQILELSNFTFTVMDVMTASQWIRI